MLENATMRRTVVRLLKPLHAISVENGATHSGTPDVNYIEGWIENKAMEHWPVRAVTPLRIKHFTPQQRIWLFKRHAAGGRVHLLLTVDRYWLLFRGDIAAEYVGRVPKKRLYELACATWTGNPPQKELISCLLCENCPPANSSAPRGVVDP